MPVVVGLYHHISLTLFSIIMYLSLSMSKKLENRVAVITGATSGMALATAKLFVEEGAYMFITGRRRNARQSSQRNWQKQRHWCSG